MPFIPLLESETSSDIAETLKSIVEVEESADTPGAYHGEWGGPIFLSASRGRNQSGFATDSLFFEIPSGPETESETEIQVTIRQVYGAGHTLDFHPNIKLVSADAASLPLTLEEGYSYVFRLRYQGGNWCAMDIRGGFISAIP